MLLVYKLFWNLGIELGFGGCDDFGPDVKPSTY